MDPTLQSGVIALAAGGVAALVTVVAYAMGQAQRPTAPIQGVAATLKPARFVGVGAGKRESKVFWLWHKFGNKEDKNNTNNVDVLTKLLGDGWVVASVSATSTVQYGEEKGRLVSGYVVLERPIEEDEDESDD